MFQSQQLLVLFKGSSIWLFSGLIFGQKILNLFESRCRRYHGSVLPELRWWWWWWCIPKWSKALKGSPVPKKLRNNSKGSICPKVCLPPAEEPPLLPVGNPVNWELKAWSDAEWRLTLPLSPSSPYRSNVALKTLTGKVQCTMAIRKGRQ